MLPVELAGRLPPPPGSGFLVKLMDLQGRRFSGILKVGAAGGALVVGFGR